MADKKIPKRSEVKKEHTWALEDLFASDELWTEALAEAEKFAERLLAMKGTLGQSAQNLLKYFELNDEISLAVEKLANYAMRKSDEDTANSKYVDMRGKLMGAFIRINTADAFASPEIMAISDETIDAFFAAEPKLELYRRAIGLIRRRKAHVLSEAEEKIIAAVGEVTEAPENIAGVFRNADLKFPDVADSKGEMHPLTSGSYIPLVESSDRVLRENAFKTLYHTLASFRNTSAAFLDGQMKQLKFYADVRKYNSTIEASLDRTEVPVEVYHNLIKAVHEKMDYMYKYADLRKDLLGVDELHMYDLYTPIVADADEVITFDEAKKIVTTALAPLGEDYIANLKEGLENRWIDIYENEGKRSGAYSAGGRPHPYVLLNHKDNLNSMFTLAHEMGHAMHSFYSCKNQPVVYSDYVIFVAEVASTCNEVLLMKHLLANTEDKNKRAYLINYFLEQFRTTLYRQTMFAEFELQMNQMVERGEALTADALCKAYHDLNKLYYGDRMVVDEEIAMEWARIPHFFYNYYVFQYATGFSAAVALANRILTLGESAVKDYLGFLSSGGSADPITLLKGAGVDMSTTKPVEDALDMFGELIDEMRELMK